MYSWAPSPVMDSSWTSPVLLLGREDISAIRTHRHRLILLPYTCTLRGFYICEIVKKLALRNFVVEFREHVACLVLTPVANKLSWFLFSRMQTKSLNTRKLIHRKISTCTVVHVNTSDSCLPGSGRPERQVVSSRTVSLHVPVERPCTQRQRMISRAHRAAERTCSLHCG